jgi:ribonucleotide monophosphatase NagD (HAD superfamily)
VNIKAVFFDLDGTLYFKQKAIEGAIRTVDYLKSKGKSSKDLGKPSESFFNMLLQDLNLKPSEVLIIGDDIATDIVLDSVVDLMKIL